MKYAINIINFGDCGAVRILAGLAGDAERAGWDGFFIWDHIAWDWGAVPLADPTIALAAIALGTERIRFGAMVTPLPRRRPWKFAREAAALDRLSGGRLIVGVGIGITQAEFDHLGEPGDFKTRAAMLDEGLEIVTGLWRGQPFSFAGQHYTLHEAHFLPTPLQQPRIPIWVAGMWPNKAPFRRAARWDGLFPILRDADLDNTPSPEQIREIVAFVKAQRQTDAPFDLSVGNITPGDDAGQAAEIVAAYAAAGVTWWHEAIHSLRADLAGRAADSSWPEAMRWRIMQGPPRR